MQHGGSGQGLPAGTASPRQIPDFIGGWGRLYGIPLYTEEIVLRNDGRYQIEFYGRWVTVNSEELVK